MMHMHGQEGVTEAGQYGAQPLDRVFEQLGSTHAGLSSAEAARRLGIYGRNELAAQKAVTRSSVLLRQVSNPLLLLLVLASAVAAFAGEWLDAIIVLAIVMASAWIGYRREYRAHRAAELLRSRIKARTRVLRDGGEQLLLIDEIVPGDLVLLNAGSLVPADARVIEATDCYVSEAGLTGESFPVAKVPGVLPADTPLVHRSNCVFMGTNVRSGTVRALVVATGSRTLYGSIARRLQLRSPETAFDRSLRRFGYLLTSAMFAIVLVVFAAHMLAGRPVVDTLLFSIALAIGLSPELLPAILTVNLARGAAALAEHGVLVRHLGAIQNLGSMDVLCTDKTGTLTEGVIELHQAVDAAGETCDTVRDLAAVNAALETGISSPLDDAILAVARPDVSEVRKLAEVPFDFVRKRVSVVVARSDRIELITKGAFAQVLEACTQLDDGAPLNDAKRLELRERVSAWSRSGMRVLAVARRYVDARSSYGRADECELRFVGCLLFLDRPKEGAAHAVSALKSVGVEVKVITGDTRQVAEHVAGLVGIAADHVLTGAQLDLLKDEALWRVAERTSLFVEVDPNQKERIILALKKMGHVVGFLGDGVNDAPATHAADTSLSVEHAVDVAREAADLVLLERDLDVIKRGVMEGRRTFANTLKYVLTTTSANLGNMVSMAFASLFLPFLPLLAGQILLNNFLSDVPALGLADDAVDPELVAQPKRWDMRFIGRYMLEFGALSSAFDLLTFGMLLGMFAATPELFRSGWFVESLLTELVIALVIRTRRPFYRSRPGTLLLYSTLLLIPVTLAIPYLPFASVLGFMPLPPALLGGLLCVTVLYVAATEVLKRSFYRRTGQAHLA